jgi:hypothetical protein
MQYGYQKTQNLMLITNPLKSCKKTHAKSYQQECERKMEFFTYNS